MDNETFNVILNELLSVYVKILQIPYEERTESIIECTTDYFINEKYFNTKFNDFISYYWPLLIDKEKSTNSFSLYYEMYKNYMYRESKDTIVELLKRIKEY